MKKAKVKATDNLIPLPLINFDNSTRSYLNGKAKVRRPTTQPNNTTTTIIITNILLALEKHFFSTLPS